MFVSYAYFQDFIFGSWDKTASAKETQPKQYSYYSQGVLLSQESDTKEHDLFKETCVRFLKANKKTKDKKFLLP